jgi:hypothetical protein
MMPFLQLYLVVVSIYQVMGGKGSISRQCRNIYVQLRVNLYDFIDKWKRHATPG